MLIICEVNQKLTSAYSENVWPYQDVWIHVNYSSLVVYLKFIAMNIHIRPLKPSSIFLPVKNLSWLSTNLFLDVLGRQEQIMVLKKTPLMPEQVLPSSGQSLAVTINPSE